MLHDIYYESLNDSGSSTPNCFLRSFPRAVHNWTCMVDGFLLGQILSCAFYIFVMSLCHAQALVSVCNEGKDT